MCLAQRKLKFTIILTDNPITMLFFKKKSFFLLYIGRAALPGYWLKVITQFLIILH